MKSLKQSAIRQILGTATLGLALTAVSGSQIVSAQWIVFDPTSYVKSTVTALEAVNATAQRATSYVNQLQQYQTMLMNLKRLPEAELAFAVGQQTKSQQELFKNMGGQEVVRGIRTAGTEVSRVSGSMSDAQASVNSLIQLQQSMGGMQESYSRRFEEARRMKLTWQQYALQEDLQIRSRVAGAAERAQEDINRVERVKRDYEFAQDMAKKIPEAEGVQQSMAIMNTQMNRVVTQLAEVNKGLTAAMASKSPEDVVAEEQAKQRESDSKRARLANIRNQRIANQEAIKEWKAEQ